MPSARTVSALSVPTQPRKWQGGSGLLPGTAEHTVIGVPAGTAHPTWPMISPLIMSFRSLLVAARLVRSQCCADPATVGRARQRDVS